MVHKVLACKLHYQLVLIHEALFNIQETHSYKVAHRAVLAHPLVYLATLVVEEKLIFICLIFMAEGDEIC